MVTLLIIQSPINFFMAFAILIITNSCDQYPIVLGGKPSLEKIIEKIESRLGDEINHIGDWKLNANYQIPDSLIKELNEKLNSFGE